MMNFFRVMRSSLVLKLSLVIMAIFAAATAFLAYTCTTYLLNALKFDSSTGVHTLTSADAVGIKAGVVLISIAVLASVSLLIYMVLGVLLGKPVGRLKDEILSAVDTRPHATISVDQKDEIELIEDAFKRVLFNSNRRIEDLVRRSDEYQRLFQIIPCAITVQDRNYRIVRYNNEFAELFAPKPGDYCYHTYKGRNEKCPDCPVERTFEDGQSHFSEESLPDKDGGGAQHWIIRTAPIRDADGEIVAAMELCLQAGYNKRLEKELDESVKKYYAIFNNIPNPVFVLDVESLKVLDANESVSAVYDYRKDEITGKSFLELFAEDEREDYAFKIMTSCVIHKARQIHKSGRIIFTTIRVSPSEYQGQKVLLITTSDITKRLEAEQQLVQLAKMTTLGEMATGVAHELNQPLSVIKTASNFFMKKVKKKEKIEDDILLTLASEIDSHVDRATKIMNHMREFGRKSDMILKGIQVNSVLRKAFEIFGQQLRLKEIEVIWDLDENLPMVMGDEQALEQVFINLLINARDAIEEKYPGKAYNLGAKQIKLVTRAIGKYVVLEVRDSGTGIPSGLLSKIFEPFFTTKQVGKGTGLGLSISYSIIKDFGGSIRAISEEGHGATFIISLPVPGKTAVGMARPEVPHE